MHGYLNTAIMLPYENLYLRICYENYPLIGAYHIFMYIQSDCVEIPCIDIIHVPCIISMTIVHTTVTMTYIFSSRQWWLLLCGGVLPSLWAPGRQPDSSQELLVRMSTHSQCMPPYIRIPVYVRMYVLHVHRLLYCRCTFERACTKLCVSMLLRRLRDYCV